MAMPPDIESVLAVIDAFGAEHAAAAFVGPDGVIATHGDADHRYDWASVTKPFTYFGLRCEVSLGVSV